MKTAYVAKWSECKVVSHDFVENEIDEMLHCLSTEALEWKIYVSLPSHLYKKIEYKENKSKITATSLR